MSARHPGYQRRRAMRLAVQASAAEWRRRQAEEAQRADAEWQQLRQQLDSRGLVPLLGPAAQERLLRDICAGDAAGTSTDWPALQHGLH